MQPSLNSLKGNSIPSQEVTSFCLTTHLDGSSSRPNLVSMFYSVQEIPPRNLVNCRHCVKKLQQTLTVIFEGLDYAVRLGMVRQKNPAFANCLMDVCDSSASCLINQVPRIYGLFLNDPCFLLSMRLRFFIWPDNLSHGLICKCGKSVTQTHLFNCNMLITFRSKVHDAVGNQLYCMFKSHKIESFLEPLLSSLADDSDRNTFGDSRGDVLVPGLDGSMIIVDVRSTDVTNSSNEKLA
ncbi:hypothetical protein P9112_008276 [Eukaryota sp. TZLM1-RC]